jgi:AcrR family transcriptional regulator
MTASSDDANTKHVSRPVVRRTGGRSAAVLSAALDAAGRILIEEGYEALGHRRVAAEADIADTTVYRRWPTKPQLVLATVEHLTTSAVVVPDLGSFEKDLAEFAQRLIAYLGRPEIARMVRALVAASSDEPAFLAARAAFWRLRFGGSTRLVERAMARGELASGADPHEVIETLAAPIYFRLLLTGDPLDSHLQRLIVNNTLAVYRRPGVG